MWEKIHSSGIDLVLMNGLILLELPKHRSEWIEIIHLWPDSPHEKNEIEKVKLTIVTNVRLT